MVQAVQAPFITNAVKLFYSYSPKSWKQAIISVIPKEGKDRSEGSSYRPSSVLNGDYRIFTSIIAGRLKNIIPDLIHQTGFIKNRQTQDNVRRALHLMNKSKSI